MSNLLISDLIAFGLSEKEARVYLALLALGGASANQIAKKSGVNRSSTYLIIDSLKCRGVVGSAEDAAIQEFFALSPDLLLHSAETSVQAAQEKMKRIKLAIPNLKGIYRDTKFKPKVRVFEGLGGLISVMDESLSTVEKQLRTFTSGETLLSLLPDYMLEWSKKRLERQIPIRGIYVDNEAARMITSMSPKFGEGVYVSKENYPSPVDSLIWDNKVGYLVLEKNIITTVVLEGKEIGLVMKNMFDMAFEQAKLNGTYEET